MVILVRIKYLTEDRQEMYYEKDVCVMERKTWKRYVIVCAAVLLTGLSCFSIVFMTGSAKAKNTDKVPQGISVNGRDLSGCDINSLGEQLESISQKLLEGKIILSIDGNEVETSLGALGIEMDLKKTEEQIKAVGKKGNIVVRYKELKDAEREGLPLGFTLKWEEVAAVDALNKVCAKYEEPAVNYGLKRENGQFQVTEGKSGYQVAKEEARNTILSALGTNWDGSEVTVDLAFTESVPKGSAEELAQVKDLLGECTTSYASSSSARAKNVERGASLVNGTVLYPGEMCSFYKLVAPIELDNGYFMAPSYASGQVVESPGGGICQVSTTLYGSLLQAELDINERSNHSMIVTYVEPSMDAAIAGTAKDLKFTNNLDAPIYIEGETAGRKITFRIYGLEKRPANRRIEYKSVELESREPEVQLVANWEAGAGSISTIESPHRGCKAKLVKCVYVDEQLVEEKDINKSSYKMTPKKVSVGMVTDNPGLSAALQAAVAANDLDSVQAALGSYGAGGSVPANGPAVPADGSLPPAGGTAPATGAAVEDP